MQQEGPPLAALLHRLAECPPGFLGEPRIGSEGEVAVGAVVSDLLAGVAGRQVPQSTGIEFSPSTLEERNRLRLVLIACWVFADPWFQGRRELELRVLATLRSDMAALAAAEQADQFVTDPDRREELVRRCLAGVGLRPAGESEAQARDRCTALDSVERTRVMRESREAQERARKVREELVKKAAQEAAAKIGRE
ncbi:MAG: hypothetical protein JNJ88_16545 [Planctomycetes bacterium]|nr:hypothetical protein [Planctomycetota bacterium]